MECIEFIKTSSLLDDTPIGCDIPIGRDAPIDAWRTTEGKDWGYYVGTLGFEGIKFGCRDNGSR